jgi:hypothetical protein
MLDMTCTFRFIGVFAVVSGLLPKFTRAKWPMRSRWALPFRAIMGVLLYEELPGDAQPSLSGVFSKALLKSLLSAADKGRLLSKVSSLPNSEREEFMRGWITSERS